MKKFLFLLLLFVYICPIHAIGYKGCEYRDGLTQEEALKIFETCSELRKTDQLTETQDKDFSNIQNLLQHKYHLEDFSKEEVIQANAVGRVQKCILNFSLCDTHIDENRELPVHGANEYNLLDDFFDGNVSNFKDKNQRATWWEIAKWVYYAAAIIGQLIAIINLGLSIMTYFMSDNASDFHAQQIRAQAKVKIKDVAIGWVLFTFGIAVIEIMAKTMQLW